MSPPSHTTAPHAPTSSVPPASGTSPDLLAAAGILHGRGWPEDAAIAALETYRAQGIVGLRRRVSRMAPAQDRLRREHFTREARQHRPNRRGDLISLRSAPHWPWRVAT